MKRKINQCNRFWKNWIFQKVGRHIGPAILNFEILHFDMQRREQDEKEREISFTSADGERNKK